MPGGKICCKEYPGTYDPSSLRWRITESMDCNDQTLRINSLRPKLRSAVQCDGAESPNTMDLLYNTIIAPILIRKAPCFDRTVPYGEDEQILEHFRQFGYVVVSNVFSECEVQNALNELWKSPQLLGRDPAIKRSDSTTWGKEHWPQQDGGLNFLQSVDPYQDQACWELAQNPHAVSVMELLWSEHGVTSVYLPNAPRWGVMRPTLKNPAWRTLENWLHWDQNPWTEPEFARVQAFACISDQTPSSGGLLCVPGFHKHWKRWGEDHPEGSVRVDGKKITRNFGRTQVFPVPRDDPAHRQVVRVLAPAGSLVLWDGRLPHQNYPNTGPDFRVVLYLGFSPTSKESVAQRREELCRKLLVMQAMGYSAFWPGGLTQLGRMITASPDLSEVTNIDSQLHDNPDLAQAIRLCMEAAEEDLNGNVHSHVAKLAQAEKTYPEIMQWYPVIFA